jgi:CBS domain containing-hemolysin-like protein
VVRVQGDTPADQLRALAERSGCSRWPVVDSKGEPVGVLHVLDLLRAAPASVQCAADVMRPRFALDAGTPVRSALRRMQQAHEPIALITQGDRPVGIATFKDLVEPLTGELASW